MTLDAIDMRILHCLESNGRISNQDLAARVALSPSACLRRVKLLEEAGVIAGYHCDIDLKKVGLEVEAVVQVTMRHDVEHWHETFVEAVAAWPEVLDALIITGSCSYLLVVHTRDLAHYSDFIVNRLYRTPGVMNITSNIVLGSLKRRGSVTGLLRASASRG
ncbi:Lrp/AsnC family transcriptional regulator [Chitinasiproducens palmae]|uniref:DNA-binding transcriptional regulator, Lrp family n=1 Tax=Chitinasiproducens palmae TaxID=1770053 RepID=A0A1H2PKD5_9BURK|nr:Lrp/AsnC family transcriptional regulator [Chitinasiproducens palmae]SDV46385.1 DNA-binding transcriptional regulator, Lrp family [Chitinasiproducens palmae]